MKMFWQRITAHKRICYSVALVILLIAAVLSNGVLLNPNAKQAKNIFTISSVSAATATDYVTDGINDNVQFQAALDALPIGGGQIQIIGGGTFNFGATVTRAINNVMINGAGLSDYFAFNGIAPIFTAGGNNWVFRDFSTDAGGINLGATTGWERQNLLLGATKIVFDSEDDIDVGAVNFRSQTLQSDVATGTAPVIVASTTKVTNFNTDLVDGYQATRPSTYFVAASNATAQEIAQADYVSTGLGADGVLINTVVGLLDATYPGTITLSTGYFDVSDTPVLLNVANVTLKGQGGDSTRVGTTTLNADVIQIMANNVTVSGLWVRGEGVGSGAGIHVGDGVSSIAYFRIINNHITNAGTDGSIYLQGAGGGVTPNNGWIESNYIVGGLGYGINSNRGHDNFFRNNRLESSTLDAIYMLLSYSNVFQGNEISTSVSGYGVHDDQGHENEFSGGYIDGNALSGVFWDHIYTNAITGVKISANGQHGVYVDYARSSAITGSRIFGNGTTAANTYDGVHLNHYSTRLSIVGNNFSAANTESYTEAFQRYAIYTEADMTNWTTASVIRDNVLAPSKTAAIGTNYGIFGAGTIATADLNGLYTNQHETFLDVAANSTTAIRSNEDLSAATPITFTLDAKPPHPRNITFAFDSHAQITAFTVTIRGITAEGKDVLETFTAADGWSFASLNAYAQITYVKMTTRTGTGVGDTMDVGTGSKIGLANPIAATGDVFKTTKNGSDYTLASSTRNTTYNTIDLSTGGAIVDGDDFEIWYRVANNVMN